MRLREVCPGLHYAECGLLAPPCSLLSGSPAKEAEGALARRAAAELRELTDAAADLRDAAVDLLDAAAQGQPEAPCEPGVLRQPRRRVT